MKINNPEELLERIVNNNLNDDDKNILSSIIKPKEKKPKIPTEELRQKIMRKEELNINQMKNTVRN